LEKVDMNGLLEFFMEIWGYFMTIRNIFCSFGTFFPILVLFWQPWTTLIWAGIQNKEKSWEMPWRRGTVDIAFASGTRRPGFESRQGIRILVKHSSTVVYKVT
jgi:hypothetical protein